MKKFLLLLGLCITTMLLFIPQAQAAEKDIGYQVMLTTDHNAVVSADCQAADLTFECVTVISTRDPGSICPELASAALSNRRLLEAKSPAVNGALSNGDLTVYNFFRNRQCARVHTYNARHKFYPSVVSTSCGGIGH